MSEFVPKGMPEIWNEVIKTHWSYLNTEESIKKLEERKKVEECLKNFLCIVHHDGKFLLPETANVLKNSIRNVKDFNAQNAIMAFDSISQYADNLFTKPWRKEFRILKMYSGFYQHEIKSNLLDAEQLFEAMGYRRLSGDILILDGPICPDQVTNVARDAMTAYVELQIMKHIYSGLDAVGLNCSWLDIYRYREKYVGGTSQAVIDLIYDIEEKRLRSKEAALEVDNYGYIDVQPSASCFTQFCLAQHQHDIFKQSPLLGQMPQINGILPENNQQKALRSAPHLMYSNIACPAQQNYQNHHHFPSSLVESGRDHLPQISHSRSLEYYSEPVNLSRNMPLPHGYSFDHQHHQGCTAQHQHHQSQQQQRLLQHYYLHRNEPTKSFYESPYDCVDGNSLGGGSSSLSYSAMANSCPINSAVARGLPGRSIQCNMNSNSAYAHPYNVSGKRFLLPMNDFNKFPAYDNVQSSSSISPYETPYSQIANHHMYASIPKFAQNCIENSTLARSKALNNDSQRFCQSEQLINLEDSLMISPPPQHIRTTYGLSNPKMENCFNMEGNGKENPFPTTLACQQHYTTSETVMNDDMHVYAKPTPKETRKTLQNATSVQEHSLNLEERGDTTDLNNGLGCDDEFISLPRQRKESTNSRSPTQFIKNQDGVGSFESWSYVFQNLDRSGYSKDLGDREDLFVQSLDLNSLNINNDASPSQTNSAEKKNEKKTLLQKQQQQQQQPIQKANNSQKSTPLSKNGTKMECPSGNITNKQKNSLYNNKKNKSVLKQTNGTSKTHTNTDSNISKSQHKVGDNKSLPKTIQNNNNNTKKSDNGAVQRKKSSIVKESKNSNESSLGSATSFKEWTCNVCTFLNLNSERICEICSHSKDNNLSTISTTADGGNAVAHNTTTCT